MDASRVNGLFQVSSAQRGALEKSLGVFIKASEEAEDLLKSLSHKMQDRLLGGAETRLWAEGMVDFQVGRGDPTYEAPAASFIPASL